MLLILSTLLVIIYTILCTMKVFKHKGKLNHMVGMTIVMVFAMMSGVLAGLIAGIMYQGDLTLSTIIGISFSLVVAILIGMFINTLALVEGIAAGIMGGMMGAMLGEMLPPAKYQLMLVFTDILFIATTLFLIVLINSEVKKAGEDLAKFTPRIFKWIITSVASAIVIITFAQFEEKPVLGQTNQLEDNNEVHDQHSRHH